MQPYEGPDAHSHLRNSAIHVDRRSLLALTGRVSATVQIQICFPAVLLQDISSQS